MNYLQNAAELAWNYKVSLVPVLFTYLIFDLQAIYRRITKIHYVPIYFIVFPSGHSDKLYAEYFGEDDYFGVGISLSEQERIELRRKIIASAIISMVFSAVFAPYVCGIISAFYLSAQQFREFVIFLMLVKTYNIFRALYRIRLESEVVGSGKSFLYVLLVYAAYLLSICYALNTAFGWAATNLEKSGALGLASAAGSFLYEDVFINIFIVAAITWVIQRRITRPENISYSRRAESET
ncbi:MULTISPECIES: hypothetical protein [unclassified Methylobacterium]|uniref:hypothetical protein n=1 Tax=unclassified Methylobacterium TaxID=2615210 RepID=UPI0036F8F8B4